MVNTTDPSTGEKLTGFDDDEDGGCRCMVRLTEERIHILLSKGHLDIEWLHSFVREKTTLGNINEILDDTEPNTNYR